MPRSPPRHRRATVELVAALASSACKPHLALSNIAVEKASSLNETRCGCSAVDRLWPAHCGSVLKILWPAGSLTARHRASAGGTAV